MDHSVYKTLCPQVLLNTINNGSYIPAIWNTVLNEDENVKILLLEQFALGQTQSEAINAVHTGCINLNATLSQYITTFQSLTAVTSNHQHVICNYLQLQKKVQTILCFVEENFGKHITTFKFHGDDFKHTSLHELTLRFASLKAKLKQHCNDALLLHIAINPAEEFLIQSTLTIHNYQRFLYFKEYVQQIEKLPFNNKAGDISNELKNCLLLLNYNKFSFVRYIMHQLKTQINAIETTTAKISQWHCYLKDFKQLQHLPHYALYPSSPSLKKLIAKNIRGEINCLKKQHKLNTLSLPLSNLPLDNEERILTSLSVSQLALFTRLLLDAGIIQTKNQSALLRKIAASVQTTKTASISEESLRIKFYSPQSAASNIVKEYLVKMMNQLRSY